MLVEGTTAGVIESHEHTMVRNVFRLDDRHIGSLMAPRANIVALDIELPFEVNLARIEASDHARFPVVRGGLDHLQGVVNARQWLSRAMQGSARELRDQPLEQPLYVPETLTGMELLDNFRESHVKAHPASASAMLVRRAGAAALCLLALAACSDGYPTEDLPQVDPARMTQAQLLAALHNLGEQPHLGKRWRYDLRADCELEITVRDGKRERHRVVLEGAAIATRSAEGITEIRLVPQAGGEARAVTALETRRWPDMVKARALLTQLELRCGKPMPPPA